MAVCVHNMSKASGGSSRSLCMSLKSAAVGTVTAGRSHASRFWAPGSMAFTAASRISGFIPHPFGACLGDVDGGVLFQKTGQFGLDILEGNSFRQCRHDRLAAHP